MHSPEMSSSLHSQASDSSFGELESGEGTFASPPAFSLRASEAAIQRQEEPAADPAPAVAADHRDPLLNSNTTLANLELIIREWQARDTTRDDRKLAYILSSVAHETGTMHAIHEGFASNYWPSYANSGYWGRGFIQLTHEGNYRQMEDETGVDLTRYEEAALLPTVSAIVAVDGMVDGEFRRDRSGTPHSLERYFPTTEGEDGTVTQQPADWTNARNIVNGDTAGNGATIGAEGQRILAGIQAYRALTDPEQSLAEYLVFETTLFTEGRIPDVNRVLEALGHLEFTSPSFGAGATAEQQNYVGDIEATGYYNRISRLDTGALASFQRDFNQHHNLLEPLREDGTLDDATFEAIMRLGNLIQTGEGMIDYAFSGEVEARDPIAEAFDMFREFNTGVEWLAQKLVSYMPVPDAGYVVTRLTAPLSFQLSMQAPSHNALAYFNPEILARMQEILSGSADEAYQVMGRRVQCLIDYEAPTPNSQHIEHRVAPGQTLGAIVRQYNTTLQATLDYNAANGNAIANPNSIGIGDLILFPDPDYDPENQPEASPTCELSAFPLPAAPAEAEGGAAPAPEEAQRETGEPIEEEEAANTGLLATLRRWVLSLIESMQENG